MGTMEAISDIITKSFITINIKDRIMNVKHLFKKDQVRYLPVLDDNKKIIGMLSLTDIERIRIRGAFRGDTKMINNAVFEKMTIEQLMKKSPSIVESGEPITEVIQRFKKEELYALPVMDGEKLVGIVTITDAINFLPQSQYCG
jgi:CBS-domain-containing membrane protein